MEDYFKNVEAIEPGKRKLDRLDNNRVLKAISKYHKGYDTNWISGKVAFMKSYQTNIYPKKFADPSDKVFLQVSIRPIVGQKAPESPVENLSGLEVYYRFLKIVVKKNKPASDKDDTIEEDKTEQDVFTEEETHVTEATEWKGSILSSSQMAAMFYNLLENIGIDKLKAIMKRVKGE